MPDWNWFTWAWAFWALMFLVVEGIAVLNNIPGDTLSEHVWKIFGTNNDNRTSMMWVWRAGFILLVMWLVPHFLTGWRWFND